jgi:hypothetical protein
LVGEALKTETQDNSHKKIKLFIEEGRRLEENCPLFPAATIGSKGLRPPPNFQFGGSFSGGV